MSNKVKAKWNEEFFLIGKEEIKSYIRVFEYVPFLPDPCRGDMLETIECTPNTHKIFVFNVFSYKIYLVSTT